jgi:H+/gluconate symporter-like permease
VNSTDKAESLPEVQSNSQVQKKCGGPCRLKAAIKTYVTAIFVLAKRRHIRTSTGKHMSHRQASQFQNLTPSTLTSKNSARLSLFLLLIPFLLFLHRLLQDVLNVSVSSGSSWPFWLRVTIKAAILIGIPLAAAIINLLSVRMKALNIIIAILSASVALLFAIVMITD